MDFTLEVAPRTTVGRHVSGLRRQGLVPGIIYGHSVKPLTVEIPGKDFAKMFHRAGRSHLLESRHRAFRPIFLDESDHRIQDHDDDDHNGVFDTAHKTGNDRRNYQHDDHEIAELVEQHAPSGTRALFL